jgi:RNA polymerase sigma-70 factor (ECF subfamily)
MDKGTYIVGNQIKFDGQLDEDLVVRVQQGDKLMFDLLVIKYQYRVVKLVNRYIKDASEAQDVAQDVFIKAYRALPNFRGDAAFSTWLFRISINTAKGYLIARKKQYFNHHVDIESVDVLENVFQLQNMETPERLLLNQEIVNNIHATIDKLPNKMRTAIMLREFEGMSYEEIATAMDCLVGTVKSRIYKAREEIDKGLSPLLSQGDFDA